MVMKLFLVAGLLGFFGQGSRLVYANDSAAELGAGGIKLVRSEGIVMQSEELTISEDEVRVQYLFRNETKNPITTMVAFPVPEWDDSDEGDINLDRESKNPMGFTVKVNGKAIQFATEVNRNGHKVSVTHHWTQTFPPDQEMKVEHRYNPVTGSIIFTPDANHADAKFDAMLARSYCVGPTLLAAMKKSEILLRTVHYILKSGANWKGPIRQFKLTLVKKHPKDKISICMPDTRKVSPTQFVVERTDFLPTDDLRVLFIPSKP
jgi:hypothetical protein